MGLWLVFETGQGWQTLNTKMKVFAYKTFMHMCCFSNVKVFLLAFFVFMVGYCAFQTNKKEKKKIEKQTVVGENPQRKTKEKQQQKDTTILCHSFVLVELIFVLFFFFNTFMWQRITVHCRNRKHKKSYKL